MRTSLFILLLPIAALAGCGPAAVEEEHRDHEPISVTIWTDKVELFVEYPDLVVGRYAPFLAHLTTLANYKPVTEGMVTLNFKSESGEAFQAVVESPVRDGVFAPIATPTRSGEFDLELIVEGRQVSDTVRVGTVMIYADEREVELSHEGGVTHSHEAGTVHALDDEAEQAREGAAQAHEDEAEHALEADAEAVHGSEVEHGHEETAGEAYEQTDLGLISFLKEQQWKIDFRVEKAQRHTLKRTVRAVGEIRPKLRYHARLVSPVEGVILGDHSGQIPAPGSEVTKGQVLASICPPPNAEGGWTEHRLAYDRARTEYERAKRLLDKKAISEKRYQEAWREYQVRKSSYESFWGNVEDAGETNLEDHHFELKAPISGIVAEVSFVPGQKVEAGQNMFTIIDPSKVWVSVRVPEKDASLVSETSGAYLELVASGETLVLDSRNSALLSVGDIVDSETRTLEVIFEVDNPDRTLKIGQFVRAALQTEEEIMAVALPKSALYDEGGWHAVYVQREGESFEHRRVRTGVSYHDMVQITEGVAEGERVVVVGGYQVKLASLTAEVGHGHTH